MTAGVLGPRLQPEPPSDAAARLLLVEDDTSIREPLAEFLREEGYGVDEAASAAEGLARLRGGRYALVVSDFQLPDQTGAWMLDAAEQAGWLQDTAVLVVSASLDVGSARRFPRLVKPVELDHFLHAVAAAVEPPGGDAAAGTPAGAEAAAPPPVHLVLYVSEGSESARRSLRVLRRHLARLPPGRVRLDVLDVGTDAGARAAGEDRVAFTPTLVRRAPAPRRWLVGDLRRRGALARLLDDSGLGAGDGG